MIVNIALQHAGTIQTLSGKPEHEGKSIFQHIDRLTLLSIPTIFLPNPDGQSQVNVANENASR